MTEPELLIARIKALNGDSNSTVLDRLYNILTTLDAKANGLLRVDSIFVAILTTFLALLVTASRPPVVPVPLEIFGYVDLFLLAAASSLCLLVVQVSWKFLGKATATGGDKYDFGAEISDLAKAANRRTSLYRIAWWFTLVGLIMLASFAIVVAVINRMPHG